MFDQVQVTNKQ